ncbi:hypothetical protein RJ639_028112 [Escallonia herrerae]|uniref:Receptor-like serine/threonine-protein kinase n=1 Tax=Escallonia herrerae TaxID=1293975 RepID=A0AA88X2G0_9ASTE|nr:hypothetical protein RJ639_044239 [Escallonia herrerae]KAK3038658.1 hypothetical protein RJ639_028112 [Escallonia herrerae]
MRSHNHKPPHYSLLFFHLLSALFLHSATSKIHNVLKRGSSLSVEDGSDIITSPDGSFACGFRNEGGNAYWLAIWFTSSADRTVVWTANRDRPVNGKGSKLSLRRNGVMFLTDVDGKVVWQTNITTYNAQRAEVLDTGNLVLRDPKGEILWQSFDYPTDTLLPSQTFTKSNKLIAAVRKGNFASGYYSFYFSNDNELKLFYDGPETSSIYWPDLGLGTFLNARVSYNSSRIAVLDDMGRFASSDLLKFSASDLGFGIKRRITMDYDGNLRLYSLNSSSGSWSVSWAALSQNCNVRGLCGRNGICTYSPEPKCACPPGYELSDPSNWHQGCKPTFNRTCSDSQQVKFVEIPNTDYFGFDIAYHQGPISVKACRELCLGDCTCEAFSYRHVGDVVVCFMKSVLFNGMQTPDFPGSVFLKLPTSVEASQTAVLLGSNAMCESSAPAVLLGSPTMYYTDTKRVRWVYLYSLAFGIGAIESLIILCGWWFLFRRSRVPATVEDGYRVLLSRFRRFSYAELKKATNSFKVELGRGGSGVVYKGVLTDGRAVAVKILGDMYQAEQEFWAEVSTIGKINHINLVRMWGFCSERRHRLLVYEYVENLSLDKHFYGIVILELVRGVRLLTWVMEGGEEQEVELTSFVRTLKMKIECKEECWMEDLVDPRLNGDFDRNQVAALVEMGLACMEQDRSKRPTMDAIVQFLQEYVAE